MSVFGMQYIVVVGWILKRISIMSNSIQLESSFYLNLEIIAGSTPMPEHPDYWRANVSIERLEKAAAQYGTFVFVFQKLFLCSLYLSLSQWLCNGCHYSRMSDSDLKFLTIVKQYNWNENQIYLLKW